MILKFIEAIEFIDLQAVIDRFFDDGWVAIWLFDDL